MTAAVGGRIEVVAPRRSLFGPDYARLGVLAAVAVGVHLWLLSHTAVTARDGIGFARYALCLQSPHAASVPWDHTRTMLDVVKAEQHPPAYPAAVWATAKVVRRAAGLPLPDSTLLACQIVSAVAGVLLVVPVYLLGRVLVGRNVGFAAALLFQTLPVPARVTSDGMADGLYLLGAAVALLLGVRAVRRPGVGGFLLCGLATGATYLVRPEGLMTAVAVGLVGGWLGLTRIWPRDIAAGRLTALAVGVLLAAGPYMAFIGQVTNKPTGRELLKPMASPRDVIQGRAAAAGGPVFAAWWTVPDGAGPVGVVGPAVLGLLKETGKSLHYMAAGLGVIGVVVLRRRIAADPGFLLLLVLAGVNAAVLVGVGTTGYYVNGKRTFYVSEHHTLLLALIGCVFAAAAIGPVGRLFGRYGPAGLLLLVVAVSLPSTAKPLHANREGHKHAGRWLAEHATEADAVIDPFCWADWYAGRTLYVVRPDPEGAAVTYAVIDDKARPEDHDRLPRITAARNVAADGRSVVVYHWPPGPEQEAKVRVVKLVR